MTPRRLLLVVGALGVALVAAILIAVLRNEGQPALPGEPDTAAFESKFGIPDPPGKIEDATGGEGATQGESEGGSKGETEEKGEIVERQRFFYGQRAYPAKNLPLGALLRARRQADRIAEVITRPQARPSAASLGGRSSRTGGADSALPPIAQQGLAFDAGLPTPLPPAGEAGQWTEIGPRPIARGSLPLSIYYGVPPRSGRVNAIAPHPTNANVAYVGAAQGGVWKTTDGGTNWTPLTDSQDSLGVSSLAVDPRDGNTVYAGTGDADGFGPRYFGVGILKSTDGGQVWQRIGASQFTNCYVADLVVSPANSQTIVAAAHAFGYAGCAQGVYRSTDGGQSWTKTSSGSCRPTSLAVSRQTPSTWYAGFAGCDVAGVFKSTDSAANWQRASSGLPAANEMTRLKLATAPSDGSRLYVILANGRELRGIYTSGNGAASWSALSTDGTFCNFSQKPGYGQCNYDLSLAVSSADPGTFYAGGTKLYKYTGFGDAHSLIGYGTGGIHVDQHVAAVDATNRVWFGNDGGVYRTADGGVTFQTLNAGLGITQFEPGNSGHLDSLFIGGSQDNGLVEYKGALSWPAFTEYLGDAGYSAIDPANSSYIFTSYVNGVVYRTLDGGRTQVSEVFSPPAGEDSEFYAPLVMDQADGRRLYIGTTRVWRTTDRGSNWSSISANFPGTITALGVPPGAPSTVYAATNGTLQVTKDSGANWVNTAGNGLPNRSFTDIIAPSSPGTAYVTASGFDPTGGNGHVFKTTNHGAGWTDISGNLPNTPANAIAVDERTNPATLYAGTDVGVFASRDGGASWLSVADLPNAVVMDLTLDDHTDKLIATTFGRGAFAVPLIAGGGGGGGSEKVLFASNRDGDYEIYSIGSDGTGLTKITSNDADDRFPVFSPDGSKIAFSSSRDGNYEVYVMNADGTAQTRLTSADGFDVHPDWSPNGSLVFASNRDGDYEVFRMAADGTGLQQLTDNPAADLDPVISPDGSKIAFSTNRGNTTDVNDYDIYSMASDGSNANPLTTDSLRSAVRVVAGRFADRLRPQHMGLQHGR